MKISILLMLALMLAGCSDREPRYCKFAKGDTVYSVLDSTEGMVVLGPYVGKCAYSVRFSATTELVLMFEIELEK